MPEAVDSTTLTDKVSLWAATKPYTIVLQPGNSSELVDTPAFWQELKQALEYATDAVVVDLMWVTSLNARAIATLTMGIQRAIARGKALSFQSLDRSTRQVLEAEWHHQRTLSFGNWNNAFGQDLEQFLDRHSQPTIEANSTADLIDDNLLNKHCSALGSADANSLLQTQQTA